jgi:hypothetical protein
VPEIFYRHGGGKIELSPATVRSKTNEILNTFFEDELKK